MQKQSKTVPDTALQAWRYYQDLLRAGAGQRLCSNALTDVMRLSGLNHLDADWDAYLEELHREAYPIAKQRPQRFTMGDGTEDIDWRM